ncbi:MAG: hypothetical protein LWX07_08510 [Bacteroidetes bacterium]|nr:hypothetical protein [Bacteroidota bacterium]
MKRLYLMLMLTFLSSPLFSQTDSSSGSFNPGFRSYQVDFTSIIFINTLTTCFDYDLFTDGKYGSAGLRAGVDYYSIGDVGGGTRNGSPCTDIDLLTRATLSNGILRVDVYGGFCSHNTSKGDYESGIYMKFGLEIKARVYKDYVGFIGKIGTTKAGYGGIGIFIGYGK